MQSVPTITVHMSKPCAECGKGGASGNTLCLKCTGDAMGGKKMKSPAGREVARRFEKMKK